MHELKKPPIGVAPYWNTSKNRIIELCGAIERYADYNPVETAGLMKMWTKEIMMQLELIEQIKEIEPCRN